MNKLYVLGVGPGSADYLPPAAAAIAKKCSVLIGGKRNLALFDLAGQEKIEITGRLDPIISAIKERSEKEEIAVLVSGDPGIYSLLPRLSREFGRGSLEVYPGISAVQYLFARLGLCWHDAAIISLHGRGPEELINLAENSGKVVVFTDPENTPAKVCAKLTGAGIKDKKVYIGEDLSYKTEKISEGRPEEFLNYSCSALNLVVITDE